MSVDPRIHKVEEYDSPEGVRRRSICKVDRITSCFGRTYDWNEVTCKRCLGRKKKEKNESSTKG